jgi:hypothetical protein
VACQVVVAQQEVTQQPTKQMGGKCASRSVNTLTIGNTKTSRGKQEALARKNESETCGAAAVISAAVMQRWGRLWWTTGGSGCVGGGSGDGVGQKVATID